MPCDASYMDSNQQEKNASRVQCLLDELDGKKWTADSWDGYHPKIYCKEFDLGDLTKQLCSRLSGIDVSKYSLEMQVWWRNHRVADKARQLKARKREKEEQEKKTALAKLTLRERRLLGI